MHWEILLGISIITGSVQTLATRVFVKDQTGNPASFAILTNLLAGIISCLLILFLNPSFKNISSLIIPIGVSGLLWGFGAILQFSALKHIEASEYSVLLTTRVFWIILVSLMIFGSQFSFIHFVGFLIIAFSVYLASWKRNKIRLAKGEWLTLATAFFFGLALANDAFILRTVDVVLYNPLSFFLTALFASLISPKGALGVLPLAKSRHLLKFIILAGMFAFTAFFYYLSIQRSVNVSQVSSIYESRVILTAVLAIIFLKERSHLWQKLLAAILCFMGILLLK